MIQEIQPHQFLNEYCPQMPDKDSYLLCYSERRMLLKRTEESGVITIDFPTFGEMERENNAICENYTYLFSIDGKRFYMGKKEDCGVLDGYTMEHQEIFRIAKPQYKAFAGITGAQLCRWYESHRFCGKCGALMEADAKERMLFCKSCGNQEYPKIMPAVIVGITHGNRILLTKYADRDFKKYALVAGFAEIGESIEETVRREVMEEVGLRVKNFRYYKSQPWSFTDTLLFGYYAEVDGEDNIVLDQQELESAEWFEREEIPVKETHLSLTNEMIVRFRDGKD